MTSRAAVGRAGEDRAAAWYEAEGYAIEARNWRVRAGEIDLIVSRSGVVVFCEVKTRTSARYGLGAEAVDWRKQQRIRTVALHWLGQVDRRAAELRFDVAQVGPGDAIEIFEGCF